MTEKCIERKDVTKLYLAAAAANTFGGDGSASEPAEQETARGERRQALYAIPVTR